MMISDFESDQQHCILPFDGGVTAEVQAKRISLFCHNPAPVKPAAGQQAQQPATVDSPCSSDDIVLSGDSFDSFKRFRDSIFKKIEASAEKDLSVSSECPSDKTEVYSIFKNLNDEFQHIVNFDTFTDNNNKKLDFVELFMVRYNQVCKDRLSVKRSDLVDFCKALEAQYGRQPKKQKKQPSFDKVLSNF